MAVWWTSFPAVLEVAKGHLQASGNRIYCLYSLHSIDEFFKLDGLLGCNGLEGKERDFNLSPRRKRSLCSSMATNKYTFPIFMSNLVFHFSSQQNLSDALEILILYWTFCKIPMSILLNGTLVLIKKWFGPVPMLVDPIGGSKGNMVDGNVNILKRICYGCGVCG
ncbi:hypothetical protein O6P43_013325 [Quillaja saponaria]|uniref:Uncharacterized protein n=1 Tax=Quillaja saponaria TaxID=32244 RepID=A0AAD7M3N5_QUISA|nr:hypothetical protein O6P43_013325 [Quillaja saponaria]